jgi:LmbE family N-acetylglucosaminyl deacetylase
MEIGCGKFQLDRAKSILLAGRRDRSHKCAAMKFLSPSADLFIPDGYPTEQALARITHLGVGAHQDDLEFMAFHGVLACFQNPAQWFGGVVCTDGGNSSRSGRYANCSDEDMMSIRREEQRQASIVGRYGAMIQLGYPSETAKNPGDERLKEDLKAILGATQPRTVYTHNPADKHETHIAVVVPLLQAIRELPADFRPEAVHGCEVWCDLDWLPDAEKVVHDVGGYDHLAAALNGIFDSQIAGGKRYDLAVLGRRRANATFYQARNVDRSDALAFAMDLTPLVRDESLDIVSYVTGFIDRFRDQVAANLGRRLGRK